jgi:hypothetical protein
MPKGEKGFFAASGAKYGVRVGNAGQPRGRFLMFESDDLIDALGFAEDAARLGRVNLQQQLALDPSFGNEIQTVWVVKKPATFTITGEIGPQGPLVGGVHQWEGGGYQIVIPKTELEAVAAFPIEVGF